MKLWRITCMEDVFPGLWQRWFKHQCVTVSYSPEWGCTNIEGKKTKGGRDWIQARNALKEMAPGDQIAASLPGRRIGRIGEVIRNETADDRWEPLIPPDAKARKGHMGRRILVCWDLEHSQDNPDLVIHLPE